MPDSGTAIERRQPSNTLSPSSLASFPRRRPRTAGLLVLWVIGLWAAFLARPVAITEAQTAAFNAKIKQAEGIMGELTAAERVLMDAELEVHRHKVWFWRFKPQARAAVEAVQPAADAARAAADAVRARRDELLRQAKASLGLWSEAGVEEGRTLFWESFASGKLFAQRQSLWDAAFVVIGSRDRDLGMLLRVLFQTLVNFFTGMVVTVFVFLFRLPWLIWSYQPALWSGLAWFSLAAVAGVSVIAAYLGLLFGAGATATYATLWIVAQQQARLEGRARAQQRLEYAAREHHD